ncbi:gamma-glutamyl-gamma-aminobutyrate hydrolase family protein [Acinetobacter baumannii]|uniref:gamma-glutamyl-gamma-aminobutyrate hydrolase n=2 Tax=Acinetobacter baumannii TaxID=470 RepID=A0A241ZGN8_ACIBA|nr:MULTISPECIES: gamma-glutamyl-gamma-aminobutyrate hydrolase family protein [Acinetobacter calcoaceticus/baumannii complex]MCF4467752.1 gamma-glutamyl-gamma-aminobutyrate hydrolase family protein [Acinetobacter baumannii]MCF4502634.1 gamma-glutamyl-gamma-aminobutyrate hydrolase family protein [Acinetobacter baumannii]MCF4515930.1 gamma-glutamyl-gamma-aminobutyrate hydrolase family protein [Acinetobacter baumannii]MCF4532662.1 gamma-glutamyl-gamma-aminobutyrate hydrolase family protein [Acineto
MRPLIGICANYSSNEQVGYVSELGVSHQEWQLISDDYIQAIEQAGGMPIILPVTSDIESLQGILARLDGVLFTGGSDVNPRYYNEMPHEKLGSLEPRRDSHEFALAQKVMRSFSYPVLAICRGYQLVNIVQQGTLYQDIQAQRPISDINHAMWTSPKHEEIHDVRLIDDSKCYEIFDQRKSIKVNSFHHQGIKDLGKHLKASAVAPDGMIEAYEMQGGRFVIGVQWHPEMMMDSYAQQLFQAFVQESQSYAELKQHQECDLLAVDG